MAHGGAIALLGIPTGEIPLDINEVVFNPLTLRGIYGREMYETWYKMTVMLQSGLDIRRPSPIASVPRVRGRLRRRPLRATPARSSWTGPHDAVRSMAADDRPDPLAFLDDELAALRERHLYRPLRVMSSAQGPIVVVDERRLICLSSNDYLGPDPPSAAARGRAGRRSASSASARAPSARSPARCRCTRRSRPSWPSSRARPPS